jgi:hypothetical protein
MAAFGTPASASVTTASASASERQRWSFNPSYRASQSLSERGRCLALARLRWAASEGIVRRLRRIALRSMCCWALASRWGQRSATVRSGVVMGRPFRVVAWRCFVRQTSSPSCLRGPPFPCLTITSNAPSHGRISYAAPALAKARTLPGALSVAAHQRCRRVTGASPVTKTPSWRRRRPRVLCSIAFHDSPAFRSCQLPTHPACAAAVLRKTSFITPYRGERSTFRPP